MIPLIIGVDHGYASIKTANFVFPSGVTAFDAPPPITQGLLEHEGRFYICGSARQPLLKGQKRVDVCVQGSSQRAEQRHIRAGRARLP